MVRDGAFFRFQPDIGVIASRGASVAVDPLSVKARRLKERARDDASRGTEPCTRKLYWKRFFMAPMRMRAISRGDRIRLLLVYLAVLLIACGSLVAQGQQGNSSVASIESLIRSQQYDQALQATKSKLSETPGDFRVWTLQGIVYSLKGSVSDAQAAFEHALRLSPTYTPALKGEVQLLYPSGDKRAIPLLERIVKADPGDKTAHEMLAMLEKKQGDCKASTAEFVLSGEGIGSHPESLEAYGYCLAQLKQFDKAIPVFEQLVALLPDRAYPKYDLAVILVETKQSDAALKILEP